MWIGCWGARNYGIIYYQGHNHTAHRAVYKFVYGYIPDDVVVDHQCRIHPCVNPAHLEAVSQSENIRRGDNPRIVRERHRSRTHCKNKHPLSGANVKHTVIGGLPHRVCRMCARDSTRRSRSRKKQAA